MDKLLHVIKGSLETRMTSSCYLFVTRNWELFLESHASKGTIPHLCYHNQNVAAEKWHLCSSVWMVPSLFSNHMFLPTKNGHGEKTRLTPKSWEFILTSDPKTHSQNQHPQVNVLGVSESICVISCIV